MKKRSEGVMNKQQEPTHEGVGTETLLTDFSCALPREAWVADHAFGEVPAKPAGGWMLMDYKGREYAGRMLTTCQPDAAVLRIPLRLKGWHAVSIGIGSSKVGAIDVRLSGDSHWQCLLAENSIREEPWVMADLTGRDLEIRPTQDPVVSQLRGKSLVASLLSVRAMPMPEEHVAQIQSETPRKLIYNTDGHGIFYPDPKPGPHNVTRWLELFADSDWNVCCFCIGGADLVNYPSKVGTLFGDGWDFPREGDSIKDRMQEALSQGWDAIRQVAEETHAKKQACWIYMRPQAWIPNWPYHHAFRSRFYGEHQHCRCVEADGRPLAHMSYAYDEVRAQLNAIAAEVLDRGADGICLALVRGFPLVRYEEPVCRRYRELYGRDARECPDADPELRLVWREFVERWLRELRDLLDAAGPAPAGGRRKLSVICGHNLEWNQRFGMDVAHFARQGLLDVVMPLPYGFRRLRGVSDPPPVDVAQFVRALKETGVPVFPSLGSAKDHDLGLGDYRRIAHAYYQAGADGVWRWDTDPHLARAGLNSPVQTRLWSEVYQPEDRNLTFEEIGGIPQGPFSPTVGL